MDATQRNAPAGVWVVAACAHQRTGLRCLMETTPEGRHGVVTLTGGEDPAGIAVAAAPPARMVVSLAVPMNEQLAALVLTARAVRGCPRGPEVVLLCGDDGEWASSTLAKLCGQCGTDGDIRVLPARAPVAWLREALAQERAPASAEAPVSPRWLRGGLTPRETEILQMCLDGVALPEQATRLGLSVRTLYVYRSAALKKLAGHENRGGNYRLWQLQQ